MCYVITVYGHSDLAHIGGTPPNNSLTKKGGPLWVGVRGSGSTVYFAVCSSVFTLENGTMEISWGLLGLSITAERRQQPWHCC